MRSFKNLFARSKAVATAKMATSPFEVIIARALAERGQHSDDMRLDPTFRQPNYVVRMCQALHEQVQALGQQAVTLSQVVMLERTACGHVDYAHKLALRLGQLARSEQLPT
ncbi:hypothetical protein [Pseudomonas viridiflava]|uniref:hypothetical protein n=1 Tax=Pseudomonas viridiflava TaxID=33069 RepID=UPI001F13A5EE|nr:hypothetical protein [Pseudomonas viridiflava]